MSNITPESESYKLVAPGRAIIPPFHYSIGCLKVNATLWGEIKVGSFGAGFTAYQTQK
jgi:hypothetical protein